MFHWWNVYSNITNPIPTYLIFSRNALSLFSVGWCAIPEAVAAGAGPQPEGVRQTESPPLHRQTNFTSQDEVAAATPPEPTQVEKDMDEVFALLRGPVAAAAVNVEPLPAAAAVNVEPLPATAATIQAPSEQPE